MRRVIPELTKKAVAYRFYVDGVNIRLLSKEFGFSKSTIHKYIDIYSQKYFIKPRFIGVKSTDLHYARLILEQAGIKLIDNDNFEHCEILKSKL